MRSSTLDTPPPQLTSWRRLAVRLVVSHVAVIVIVAAVVAGAMLVQTRRYFIAAERRSLLIQAQAAANACDETCVATGILPVIPTEEGISVPVLSTPANIAPQQQRQANNALRRLVLVPLSEPVEAIPPAWSAPRNRARQGTTASAQAEGELLVAVPVRSDGKVVATIEARGDLANTRKIISDLTEQLLVTISLAAILAGFVGWWRARRIAGPINALTRSVTSIANGDFHRALPPTSGHDEVAALGLAFSGLQHRVIEELAAREAFVADASHELRTPLTSLKGAVDVLLDGAAEKPESREKFLRSIERSADRLIVLTNDLLTLHIASTSSDNRGDSDSQSVFDVHQVTSAVCAELADRAEQIGVRLVADSLSEPIEVSGDERKAHQIVVNLVANALAHSPRGSEVTVTLRRHAVGALLEITDQGVGIPNDERERVFDRFVRLQTDRNRSDGGGSGLGLAIVREMATLLGATVSLDSGPGGLGTTAQVKFLLASSPELSP